MRHISLYRSALALAAGILALAVSAPELPATAARLSGTDLSAALAAVVHVLVTLVAVWLLGGTALVVGSGAVPAARRWAPRSLAAVLTTGAVSFAGLATGTAHASTSELDGLLLPDRVTTAPAAPLSADPDAGSAPSHVVVEPGDCLWMLASAQLGPAATDAQIAAATQLWHETNRAAIGSDPDVLLVGQVLDVPALDRLEAAS